MTPVLAPGGHAGEWGGGRAGAGAGRGKTIACISIGPSQLLLHTAAHQPAIQEVYLPGPSRMAAWLSVTAFMTAESGFNGEPWLSGVRGNP